MNVIDSVKECVGCSACVDICPVEALKLKKDSIGFYKPKFTSNNCINCSKCVKICPSLNGDGEKKNDSSFYCGWSNNETVRNQSTSGGAFSMLADEIVKAGGVVFGARYSDDKKSVVISSTDECGLNELVGTKYCQAFPNNMFKKTAEIIKNRKVMIVGTPCVISAFRNIFKDNENLLLVDFMCGGVVPSDFLESYVTSFETKYKTQVNCLNMRDKSKGWDKPCVRVDLNNGKTILRNYKFDPYLYYYYQPYFKTGLCLHCPFTQHNSSDLTIGDFWGHTKAGVKNDGKGISLVCVNTKKGELLLNGSFGKMELKKISESDVAYAFKEKSFSKEKLEIRKKYLNEVEQIGFMKFAENHQFKYGTAGAFVKTAIKKVTGKG